MRDLLFVGVFRLYHPIFAILTPCHLIFISIISVTDRSLPNKPCKTCKNRFHASCLYKVRIWSDFIFSTHAQ